TRRDRGTDPDRIAPTSPRRYGTLDGPTEGRRMKAIAVVPGTKAVQLVDRPEPAIVAPDDIKLKVLRVGICGTDREEAAGGRAKAPPAHQDLVLGHEMFGQVVDVGRAVTSVKPGDYAVFTVRRAWHLGPRRIPNRICRRPRAVRRARAAGARSGGRARRAVLGRGKGDL